MIRARIIDEREITPGATELGSCLTDATRESRARRTVRVFTAMLRPEPVTQQSSRPVDPVEALKPRDFGREHVFMLTFLLVNLTSNKSHIALPDLVFTNIHIRYSG
jgi:hypothetical protein